jgi:hypothetical protein
MIDDFFFFGNFRLRYQLAMEEASQWFMELQQALAKEDRESLMRVTKSAVCVFFLFTL